MADGSRSNETENPSKKRGSKTTSKKSVTGKRSAVASKRQSEVKSSKKKTV